MSAFLDIVWDLNTLDCPVVDGAFLFTDNPSVQNGAILLMFRATNFQNPMMGIGINQIRGGDVGQAAYEMSRWKTQVIQDGGKAQVTTTAVPGGNVNFKWEVDYL